MNDIDFDIILTFSIDNSFDFFSDKWVMCVIDVAGRSRIGSEL